MPRQSECVFAANFMDALAACQCRCENVDAVFSDSCDSPGVCEVTQHLDCTLTDEDEKPVPAYSSGTENWGCYSIYNAEEVQCPSPINLFDASVSVLLADGTSTTVSGLVGYLSYSISGCSGGVCDFEMPVLTLPTTAVSGVYLQRLTTGTYQLNELFMQMEGTLSGTYNQARGNITFPTGTFTVSGTLASALLDSVALPLLPSGERLSLSTDQIVGSSAPTMSSTPNPLNLNLYFDVPGGTASVSLTSR